MSINFDKFGHCVLCHKNMVVEKVIDGKVQLGFTSDHMEEEFLLDDGSRMRVCMCKECNSKYDHKDYDKIMQCVNAGWEKEMEERNWEDNRKENYRKKYNKLKIITSSLGKPDDVLKKELKEFKDKKIKQWLL